MSVNRVDSFPDCLINQDNTANPEKESNRNQAGADSEGQAPLRKPGETAG
jgi:hypothetical protein